MRRFSFFLLLSLFFGCGDSSPLVCPECKMPIDKKENSSYIDKVYFDDIGCMVLWTKEHKSRLDTIMVFAKDTKKYIKAITAFYTIDERTPMGYGFTAYQNRKDKSIDFEEMRLRMLRGETMKNPKIRKQILGY